MKAKTEDKPRSWRRRLLSGVAQLAILLVLVLAAEAFMTRGSVGVVAPAIEAPTLGGERFSLEQYRGKPAVVHFWATWCPVCELEQGMIDGVADDLPMITVSMQSGRPQEVHAYLAEQGVDYPVVNDERGWIAQQYGVKAVPASFILDGEGRVRFATRGYTTGWGLRIRLWLADWF